jgi:hypothetical protein
MDYEIETIEEEERGCGFRCPDKTGVGIYLVAPELNRPCGRLPFPLNACPCCGGGIKPSRSWTWIEPSKLLMDDGPDCKHHDDHPEVVPPPCWGCYMDPESLPLGRHGLLWVGGSHYRTPEHFTREAAKMGISRKLPAVPKDFMMGVTVVYLGHRTAVPPTFIERPEDGRLIKGDAGPGIFCVFRPTGVDLVVESADPADLPDRAKKLKDQLGKDARLVKVVRKDDTMDLPFTEE